MKEENVNVNDLVVSEKDFPEKSDKLKALMQKFSHEENVSLPAKSERNPLTDVKVSSHPRIRDLDDLNEEEKRKVWNRINSIGDYTISGNIQTFGSTKESPITKHAEIIVSKYSASEVGEISDAMTELVATIRTNSPKEIVKNVSAEEKKQWGIISGFLDMIAFKNAKKKMAKALAEHQTIDKNIKAIEVELKKQQISFQKDIQIYEEMGRNTYTQVSEFELDCVALNVLIDDAQAKMEELTSKGEVDYVEANKIRELSNAIDRMERKLQSIQTVRTSTIQTLPQLMVLILGDEIICEKIDEIDSLVIPLWKWQYAIAIGALKQKEALTIHKAIRGVTSWILTGNAQMLHDNMIAAQEELYATAVAIEDLVTVQEYIDDMVSVVNEKRKEAVQKCKETLNTLQNIEQKNWRLIATTTNATDTATTATMK